MKAAKIFALLLPVLASCEKELDFHYHHVESQLVVEGSTSATGTTVSLTRTCPMDEAMDLTPVTDAQVLLTDLTDNTCRALTLDSDGAYTDATPGISGHDYRLDISRNGNEYSAESTMLQATQILDLEFQWIKMPYDHVAALRIAFSDLPEPDTYYWIKMYRNGESYRWLLSSDQAAVDGVIAEVTMTTRKNPEDDDDKDTLLDGDEVRVVINPISRSMYDYLIAIQSDSNGPRMFAGAYCLGYYLASPAASATVTFRPRSF